MPKTYTSRGFAVYEEFVDTRGNDISIAESSSSEEDCIWIFCKNGFKDDSAHVNVEQAKLLINALQEFVDDYED